MARRLERTVAALGPRFKAATPSSSRRSAQERVRAALQADLTPGGLDRAARGLGRAAQSLRRDREVLRGVLASIDGGFRPPYARHGFRSLEELVSYLQAPTNSRRSAAERRREVAGTNIKTSRVRRGEPTKWSALRTLQLEVGDLQRDEKSKHEKIQELRAQGLAWSSLAARSGEPTDRRSLRRFAQRYGRPLPKALPINEIAAAEVSRRVRRDSTFAGRGIDLVADLVVHIYGTWDDVTLADLALALGVSEKTARVHFVQVYRLRSRHRPPPQREVQAPRRPPRAPKRTGPPTTSIDLQWTRPYGVPTQLAQIWIDAGITAREGGPWAREGFLPEHYRWIQIHFPGVGPDAAAISIRRKLSVFTGPSDDPHREWRVITLPPELPPLWRRG